MICRIIVPRLICQARELSRLRRVLRLRVLHHLRRILRHLRRMLRRPTPRTPAARRRRPAGMIPRRRAVAVGPGKAPIGPLPGERRVGAAARRGLVFAVLLAEVLAAFIRVQA